MKRFSYRTIFLALLALALGLFLFFRKEATPSPTRPLTIKAVREHGGATIYFNPAAQSLIESAAPDALAGAGADRARFQDAVSNPETFRRLDRKHRFDALVLAGDPATYFPLLMHLQLSGDWSLAHLDDTALIFTRGKDGAWSEASLEPVEARLGGAPSDQRAALLATIANQLMAVRRPELALPRIETALSLDPRSTSALNQLARYHLLKRDWKAALEAADRALKVDGDYAPALFTKVQVLTTRNKFSDAYPISKRLLKNAPDAPHVLFLHAKVAHGVRALTEEVEVLRKLIDLAEKSGQPTGTYQVFLGQAYAAIGDGDLSLQAFRDALASGGLPPDQASFAREAVDRLEPPVAP